MKTKVRKIGNSFGFIVAKSLLEQAGVKDEVSLSIEDSKIIIEAVKKNPREGWAKQFAKANSLEDKERFFEDFENEFDEKEWTW